MTDVSKFTFRVWAAASWLSVWIILIDDTLIKALPTTPDHDLLKVIALLLVGIFCLLAVERLENDR